MVKSFFLKEYYQDSIHRTVQVSVSAIETNRFIPPPTFLIVLNVTSK